MKTNELITAIQESYGKQFPESAIFIKYEPQKGTTTRIKNLYCHMIHGTGSEGQRMTYSSGYMRTSGNESQ